MVADATLHMPAPDEIPEPAGGSRSYNVTQAAALLGVSRVTIWRWISAGRLPAMRLGHRTVRLDSADLERLLASREPAVTAARDGMSTDAVAARESQVAPGASAHVVQFYESDPVLLDAVAEFIGTALGAEDAGIVVATAAHRAGLDERLRDAGLDVCALRSAGRYIVLDAAETLERFMVQGMPDPVRFGEVIGDLIAGAAAGGRRVCVFGEMVALLAEEGNHAATLRLEELWNAVQQTRAFALFCAYPLERLGGEACAELVSDVCATHTHIIPTESYTALSSAEERQREIVLLQQKAQSLEAALAAERTARLEAETALRLRDDFLGMASHELKTPLTSLKGYVQLLDRRLGRAGETTEHPLLARIDAQVRTMSELVEELLDVSRIEAGKLTLHLERFDLTALLREVLTTLQDSLTSHSLVLAHDASHWITADRGRLTQVLVNLLTNAAKFAPAGSEIRGGIASSGTAAGAELRLWVQDRGTGIAPEDQERVFERFYQVTDEAHPPSSGLGIGLYIARQIVEQHGGRIWVESTRGAGSTFWVALPRREEPALHLV